MKRLPILTTLLVLGAALPTSADSLMLNLRSTSTNAAASADVDTPYLTLSPAHDAGTVLGSETTWNNFSSTAASSSLLYSDGSSAAGVTLTFGTEASAGSGVIDLGTVSSINTSSVYGTGGAAPNQQVLVGNSSSIYGNGNNSSNSAVGRAGWIGGGTAGAGIALGMRVDGLAAGDYRVYVMARNTNSNATTANPMNVFASAGPLSTSFDFTSLTAAIQANTTYPNSSPTAYNTFVNGTNFVTINVTISAGESLFLATDGGSAAESRGFLNMVQITPDTEPVPPFTWSKGDGDWDITSFNWNADTEAYAEPAQVTFPTLTDVDDGINTVNLTAAFSPAIVNVNNGGDYDTTAYAFIGTGAITGDTGITKNGNGIVKFSNANNSYSGPLNIQSGAVIKNVADGTTGEIVVANGATFVIEGGVSDGSGQTADITGAGQTNQNYFYSSAANQRGALQSHAGENTWAGDIVLSGTPGTGGNTRIGVQDGASLSLTGTISEAVAGMSPYFRSGNSSADIITLAGTCAWSGPTRIFSNGGIVTITADDKLPTGSSLIVGPTAGLSGSPTFDLAGFNQTVAGLSGSGGTFPAIIMNTGGGQSTLTLSPAAPISYAGGIQDDVQIVIGGTEAQTLSGQNSYSGNTTVNSGASLIIGDTGELRFHPKENGVTNSVGGAGSLQYDGKLMLDMSLTDITPGNSWTLVHGGALGSITYGTTFSVTDSSAGNFTETAVDSGIWKLVDAELVWTFTESTGILSLAMNATDPYDAWIATHFPGETNPTIIGKNADPDGDGLNNLAEYALNGTPDDGADNGYHAVAIEDTNSNSQNELTLTIAVRKAGGSPVFSGSPLSAVSNGVRYTIEGSLDLIFPTSAASEASPASGPGGLPSDYEYRRFRLDASEGLSGKGFLRVKTEAAP